LKIKKKIFKITEIEFQNYGPSFFASVSPVYRKKKFDSIRTKLTEEIHFEVCPYRHDATMVATPPSNAMRPLQAPRARCKHQVTTRCGVP